MNKQLQLKIEHYLAHGLFFLLIFGLAYWIWPLDDKKSSDYMIYLMALAIGTLLFNAWKRHWTNRLYDSQPPQE